MKNFFKIFTALFLLSVSSCGVLDQAAEYKRFIQCDFAIADIRITEIGGVRITLNTRPEDINMFQMMALTQSVMTGSLTAKSEITLRATNHSTAKAAIAGMDWVIMMKEQEYLTGSLDHTVEILPESSGDFKVKAKVDLLKILNAGSLNTALDFAFSNNRKEVLKKAGIMVKIRPYYKTGGAIQKYPGFITVSYN